MRVPGVVDEPERVVIDPSGQIADRPDRKHRVVVRHATVRTHQLAVGEKIVGQAVERGELPRGTDPELAVDLMLGPLYWRLAVARTPIDEDYLEKLAATVIAALGGAQPAH